MATRARIGIQQEDGTVIAAYQHWDGYPGGLGYTLEDHWTDPAKVTEAIQLGDASKWGQIIGDKIDFDDREHLMQDIQNVYYGRDRGEKDVGHKTYKSDTDYLDSGFNAGEEYIYLLRTDTGKTTYLGNPQGEWLYADYNGRTFKPLEEDAINDHIDNLKRYLEMKKEREAA